MGQPEAAHFPRGVGRQQAMGAGLLHQGLAQFGGRTMGGLPGIVFQRDDLVGDEMPDPGLQGEEFFGKDEVHG
ncbi:hypothetical protein D9M70_276560 [compost metagenome]